MSMYETGSVPKSYLPLAEGSCPEENATSRLQPFPLHVSTVASWLPLCLPSFASPRALLPVLALLGAECGCCWGAAGAPLPCAALLGLAEVRSVRSLGSQSTSYQHL